MTDRGPKTSVFSKLISLSDCVVDKGTQTKLIRLQATGKISKTIKEGLVNVPATFFLILPPLGSLRFEQYKILKM